MTITKIVINLVQITCTQLITYNLLSLQLDKYGANIVTYIPI